MQDGLVQNPDSFKWTSGAAVENTILLDTAVKLSKNAFTLL